MAFKKIELTEEEQAAGNTNFHKFDQPGDKFSGVFVSVSEEDGKYGKRKNYKFKTRNAEGAIIEAVITPPTDLDRKMRKVQWKPGYRVKITYTHNQDIGKESPMKVFDLEVDDAPPAPKAAAPKPLPPPPPPAADELDDIPF